MRVYRAFGLALVVHASLLLSACTPEAITALTEVTSVIVQPDTVDVDVDAHATVSAVGYNAYGIPMVGLPPNWSSADPSIAQVTQSGDVLGVAEGETTITATVSGKAAQAFVRVRSRVASVTVEPASATLTPGQTVQLTATPRSASGEPITGRSINWTSSNSSVATVSSSGLVTGATSGVAVITATSGGKNGTSSITVTQDNSVDVCSPSYVPPSQSPMPGGIDITVTRLDGGCGTVLVSNGIPLVPGALTAAQTSQLRLFVGGTEQALYVEPLKSTHSGGSLRAVLVQFTYALAAGKPVQAQLVLGQPRGTVDIAKPTASRTSPVAVALPTNPNYLISTQLVGPTISVSASSQLSATHAKYEQDFVTYADKHWALEGSSWENNYYDRALVYYAFWVRSGNVEYWSRGTAHAVSYRRDYLEANDYNSTPHWAQLEGLEKHYLLTGDNASRVAIGRVADKLNVGYQPTLGNTDDWWDNRIQERLLQSYLLAWRLNAPSGASLSWPALLDESLPKILGTQSADGSYRFTASCGESLNFMTGLLNDMLIQYYTYYKADSRIPGAVRRSVDFMWSSQWIPSEQAFIYISGPCPNEDDPLPAPDLNNLLVTGFSWTYRMTQDAAYRSHADDVFAGGVNGAWLDGSKQFNQEYTISFRHLGYR